MTNTWNFIASYDKPSYDKGDTMTATISGDYVLTTTTTTQQQSGALTLTLTAADGAKTSISLPATAVNVSTTTTSHQPVKITGVSDTSGKAWTIGATGLTATALA